MGKVSTISHRWTDESARQLYELYAVELREMTRKRSVDLGISMGDGDNKTAFEALKENRRRRMSDEHRSEAWNSWQVVIDPLVKKMSDLYMHHTVPVIMIDKSTS